MKKSYSNRLIKVIKWIVISFILFKVALYLFERLNMKNIITEKSGIEVPFFFKVLENNIFHTSSAFDSDYTWNYKLKITETDFQAMSEQIENSKFYNIGARYNFDESIYDSIRIYNLKGYWISETNTYKFHETEKNSAEKTNIEIDKSKRTIKVNLMHL